MSMQLPPTAHSNNRELLKNPLTYFLTLTREFGDVVCYRPALEPAYLINHPEYVRHVLVDNNRNYTKGTYINKMFHTAVADGLLTAEGEKWHRQRQLMQPSFNKKRIAKLDNVITSQASRVFEGWQEAASKSQPIYLSQEISALTLAIATRVLFGVDLGEEIGQVGRAVDMGVALLEKPNNPRFQTSIRILEEIVQGIITSRRHSMDRFGEAEDLLGTMMQTRDEETGLGMDDASLRNQVITLLLGGYDTTASALTWTFYMLSQHPGTVIRLRQELQAALGGRTPTSADLPALEFTRMVFEESLRMYSPAWVLGRVAQDEDIIGNYNVPAGTVVAISPYTLHRHLGFWDEPEIFNPNRFAPECSNGRHPFAYIPFGAGPRKCIGSSFAMVEAQLIIATAMQRFDLSLVSDHEIKPEIGFVARPDRQMKMMVSLQAGG